MLTLSLRDRDRLVVLREVDVGVLTPAEGAHRLRLSRRHFRRLLARFRKVGDEAVIHRARGRPSNRRVNDDIRLKALLRAQDPLFHDFGPTLLAEHLSRDPDIGPLSPHTLRRWLMAEGLWTPKRRRKRHRQARPRKAALGEMIQLDGSQHRWLEDRYPHHLTLLKAADDATNRILIARFVPRETGAAHRQLLMDYLARHGRPLAFYTDMAACFGQFKRSRSKAFAYEEREPARTHPLIYTALQALDIELILAHSPQAKGRIERNFGTSQDRLVKELRLAKISTPQEANRFLTDVYVPFWNQRFAVEPAHPEDLHRPLPKDVDLQRLFADTDTRILSNDFTIRYRNQRLQIPKAQANGLQPKAKIIVERRLDGSVRFRHNGRYLKPELVAECQPKPPRQPRRPPPPPPQKRPMTTTRRRYTKPAPSHPWKAQRGTLRAAFDD